uniref:SHSP domain-containing protein n=1 Tax=Oryza brachyantha TaxID=4533 RepID=J3MWP8_ORYBR
MSLMVTSCNLLSPMAPRPPPAVLKASSGNGKPAAAAMAVKTKSPRLCVRANNSTGSQANATAASFGIAPFALMHPKFPPTSGNKWRITEDDDYVKVWLHVGEEIDKRRLQVRIEHRVLVVGYTAGAGGQNPPANSLDVRLLLPNLYDTSMVEAELTFGSLLVTIAKLKPKEEDVVRVPITARTIE